MAPRAPLPSRTSLLLLALGAAAYGACDEGGYDVAHGCEQSIACAREKGQAPPDRAECEKSADTYYRSLLGSRRRTAARTFEGCRSRRGCDFEACLLGR